MKKEFEEIFYGVIVKMYKDKGFFENLCKYCIENYQVMSSGRMISSLIYQCCKELGMDATAVEGLLVLEINGYKRQYAHCFNVYKSNIIDASIYQFALMNKAIENMFPLYVVGSMPEHIEYSIMKEIKYENQMRFKKSIVNSIIKSCKEEGSIVVDKFTIIEDSKKKNLFYANKD